MTEFIAAKAGARGVGRTDAWALACEEAEEAEEADAACTSAGLWRICCKMRLKLSSKLAASSFPSGVLE